MVGIARRDVLALLGGMASALRPLPLRAQEAQKRYRVAYLALAGDQDAAIVKRRLDELGYHEGRNLIFDFRSADGDQERLPRLAAELVATHPDVIVTGFGTAPAKAAQAATCLLYTSPSPRDS